MKPGFQGEWRSGVTPSICKPIPRFSLHSNRSPNTYISAGPHSEGQGFTNSPLQEAHTIDAMRPFLQKNDHNKPLQGSESTRIHAFSPPRLSTDRGVSLMSGPRFQAQRYGEKNPQNAQVRENVFRSATPAWYGERKPVTVLNTKEPVIWNQNLRSRSSEVSTRNQNVGSMYTNGSWGNRIQKWSPPSRFTQPDANVWVTYNVQNTTHNVLPVNQPHTSEHLARDPSHTNMSVCHLSKTVSPMGKPTSFTMPISGGGLSRSVPYTSRGATEGNLIRSVGNAEGGPGGLMRTGEVSSVPPLTKDAGASYAQVGPGLGASGRVKQEERATNFERVRYQVDPEIISSSVKYVTPAVAVPEKFYQEIMSTTPPREYVPIAPRPFPLSSESGYITGSKSDLQNGEDKISKDTPKLTTTRRRNRRNRTPEEIEAAREDTKRRNRISARKAVIRKK